jgi:hypothetical protein
MTKDKQTILAKTKTNITTGELAMTIKWK